ncbi:MAG TPA: formyltransferase family protein [Bacteroidia bacterium]|jgi:hypothetical protein|nr:formyltransferase family protein [Bacteroidia bacterium]
MRIIFVGRDNSFNRKIVQEFSTEHQILCCLFIEPERSSWKSKSEKISRRIKKYGLLQASDELAFHLFDRFFLRTKEPIFWKTRPEYYNNSINLSYPIHQVDDINNKKWVAFCNSLSPDIILATCSHVIFKPELYNTPALGTFVIHEGLTPEYRGLHTPLWALMKKEFQYIGYTVIKVNDQIDGGEILTQGTYPLGEDECYRTWSWVGHNAIISGLENIRRSFKELEKKRCFQPLNTQNRKSSYYTWMRFSRFLWLCLINSKAIRQTRDSQPIYSK